MMEKSQKEHVESTDNRTPFLSEKGIQSVKENMYNVSLNKLGLTEEEAREWADAAEQSVRNTPFVTDV